MVLMSKVLISGLAQLMIRNNRLNMDLEWINLSQKKCRIDLCETEAYQFHFLRF